MPHSSGGGSHSGGSHGGSHGRSGGSSGPRISRKYYSGARRFRYHDGKGIEHYIYCSQYPQKMGVGSFIFSLLFLLPFFGCGFAIIGSLFAMFSPPKPLTPHYTVPESYIDDQIDVINNDEALENTMDRFRELTGICPYVATVYDSDWNEQYSSLEEYAYDYYVDRFSDEDHFVIVYSEPENAEELDYVDWSWEGMQGDNTDDIITVDHFEEFNTTLQNNIASGDDVVGESLYLAFSESLNYMMEKPENAGSETAPIVFFTIVWFAFIIFAAFSNIKTFINSRRDYQEVPMDQNNVFAASSSTAAVSSDPYAQFWNNTTQPTGSDPNDAYSQNGFSDPYANQRGTDQSGNNGSGWL
ncbi:MAG TPA: hypothetical protein PLQ04_01250 [Lachnospiraceae bacterium]|nr:hypothetical protein [Lachnospiraceae bacterium]